MASSNRSTDHVVLVGMMGSGKSTVGRLLADRLGRPFVDVDACIELQDGASIPEIFERRGERGFRDLEAAVLPPLVESPWPAVIALGGGAVTDTRVREALSSATVVWLRARTSTLSARVAGGEGRPLLAGGDAEGTLVALAAARDPLYEAVADLVVDVDRLSPDEVAARVAAAVEPR